MLNVCSLPARANRFCRKARFLGQNPKIWCQEFNDLQTPNLSKKQLCDRTLMPPGAPRPMKKNRPSSMPGQPVTIASKGLVVRSCSDWCPAPATALDLDTCRHHALR